MLPQPLALPWTNAKTKRNSEAVKVVNPSQSILRPVENLALSTLVRVITTATIPIGMLMKKIHRQPMPLVMAPPTNGPMATAPPTTAP